MYKDHESPIILKIDLNRLFSVHANLIFGLSGFTLVIRQRATTRMVTKAKMANTATAVTGITSTIPVTCAIYKTEDDQRPIAKWSAEAKVNSTEDAVLADFMKRIDSIFALR